MRVSQKIKTPETAAKKSEMKVTEDKLFYALTKLQVLIFLFRVLYQIRKQGIYWISRYLGMYFTNPQLTLTSKSSSLSL
jgi:uncharacterized membrane protein